LDRFVLFDVRFVRYVHPVLCGFASGSVRVWCGFGAGSVRVLFGFVLFLRTVGVPFCKTHKRILNWCAKVFNKIAPFVDPPRALVRQDTRSLLFDGTLNGVLFVFFFLFSPLTTKPHRNTHTPTLYMAPGAKVQVRTE
jgi:hypothetical protein